MSGRQRTWSAKDLTPGTVTNRDTSGGVASALPLAGGESVSDGARQESSDKVLGGGKPANN